jgi:PAS domain S-box-containing protein
MQVLIMSNKPTYEELEQKVQELEREVVKREQVEESLKKSEDLKRSFMNSATDGFILFDAAMNVVDINEVAMSIFGVDCKVIGANAVDVSPDVKESGRYDQYMEVIRTGQPLLIEELVPHPKFGLIHLSVRAFKVGDGLGTIITDMTKRKLLELKTTRFGRILEGSLNEIYIFDANNYHFIQVNKGARENLGYSIEELQRLTPLDLKPEFTPESFLNLIKPLQTGERDVVIFETAHKRKDGSLYHVEVHLQLMKLEHQAYYVAIILDITKRKLAEDALGESEERYRSFVQHFRGIAYRGEMDFTPIFFHGAVEEITGYTERELVDGKPRWDQVIHPEDLPAFFTEDEEKLHSTPNYSYEREYRIIRKDGSVRWVQEVIQNICDASGKPAIVQGAIYDIADRKQAEEALRESEEKYRSIFDSAGEGIVVIQDGIISFFNSRMTEMLGLSSTDISRLTNESFLSFIHPEDQKQVADRYDRRLKGQELPSTYSARLIDRGGESLWVDLSPTFISWKGKPAILTFVTDITERKMSEEELQKLASVVKHSSELINLATLDGKMIFLNESGCKMLGIDPDEVERTHIMEVFPDHQRELVQNELLPELMQGNTWEGELQYRNLKSGNLIDVHARTFTVHAPNTRKPLFLANVSMEITDRKLAEKEKNKLETRLLQAQKMESIGTLAGGIAHDFNNILTPLMAHSEMALMDLPEDSPVQFNLKEMIKASKRARDLVKQILTFSRQNGQGSMPLKLGTIVKEALKLLRSSIPTTIEIQQKALTDSDMVLADPTQMHQILMNLCTNAYHEMDEGGTIEVSLTDTKFDSKSAKQFDNLNPGDYLQLSVRDTGPGMAPDVVEKIFEPYFTTKERGVGTGLGLAVVHGIVQNHGGSIQVESDHGKGTTFHVFLPKLDIDTAEKIEHREPIPTGNERILFIDDEAPIVDVGKQMLERLGYEVITRTSSIEALELFRSQQDQFDVVITDMTMPNMTGVELSKKMINIRPDIPVILCTGFSEQITEEKATGLGIQGYVMKPIIMSEIAHKIRKILDEK